MSFNKRGITKKRMNTRKLSYLNSKNMYLVFDFFQGAKKKYSSSVYNAVSSHSSFSSTNIAAVLVKAGISLGTVDAHDNVQ